MPKFMITVRSEPGGDDDLSPEEIQQIIERYHAWGMRLAEQNRLVLGEKLRDDTGRVVRGAAGGGMAVTDGPFAEGKEVVGGFWIIVADDVDDALDAVSSHPHLGNGSIEVREIQVLDDL